MSDIRFLAFKHRNNQKWFTKFNAFFNALGPKREIVCVCFLDQRCAEEAEEEGRGNERRGFKGGRTQGEGCSTYVCTYTLVVHTTILGFEKAQAL